MAVNVSLVICIMAVLPGPRDRGQEATIWAELICVKRITQGLLIILAEVAYLRRHTL
jgi:hypothetical protein